MEGTALDRLAWDLGLAPALYDAYGPGFWHRLTGERWEPHTHLVQADAVFRQLRVLGWDTHVQYFAQTGCGQVGAWKRDEKNVLLGQLLQWHGDATQEAHALLLVSVLAVSREGTQDDATH
jgi:hypothetical protein